MKMRNALAALFLALSLLIGVGSARAQTPTCSDNFLAIQNLINQDIISGVGGGIKATTVNSLMTIQNNCYLNVENYNSSALAGLAIAPNTSGGFATWPVAGGGAPGGGSGQLQYNNAGVFGGFTPTGDLTFSVPNFTLNTVNSSPGSFGSSTQCPTITVNGKGLVTAASQTACAGGGTLFFPLTVSGTTTSGGIPYFASTTSLASSGLLTANALMIGGGAGAAPSTTTTGAGVLTALGVAVNAATGLPLINATLPTVGHCLQWGSSGITDAGGSCTTGGGGGTVSSGNSGALTYYASTGTTVSGTATTNASISGAALSLGSSGVNGSIIFGGYTSGTVTLEPVTAALGSAIAFLPANTGEIAELNFAQTWSAAQTFGASDIVLTGASGCATFSAGVLSGTGLACSGGGAVSSVANSDGTLTISPTTGAVVASLALGHANTWTGNQTFPSSSIATTTLTGALQAGQFPAMTGDVTNTAGSLSTTVGKIGGQSVSLAGGFSTVGAYTITLTATGATTLTLPNSGTLVTTGVTSLSSLATIGTVTTGVWNGSSIPLGYGGTNAALTASNGGIVYSTASAFAILSGTVTAGQCLLSGSSAAPTWGSCSGAAAVSSVSNSDGTLTISPTAGAVVGSLALGHANTWTGAQTFTNGDLLLKGSTSGSMTLEAPAAASTYVMTFPAATDTVAALGVANAFTGNNSHSGVETFTGSLKVATRVISASTDTASATTDYFLCVAYTSTGAVTETLPSSPPTGLTLLIKDCGGAAATHNITITPAAGTIDGASTYVMSTNYGSVAVTFANSQWSLN
jgi:hypothetical protein